MANKINIAVNVSDNGTISLTEKSIKKLQNANAKLGASVQANDRFWKGASQQSSNSTKNFSKLSQTIGGSLVPAYASLAANIFAVSAAFNFLKSAGDLRLLEEGQVAYASATGIALRSLSKELVEATGNQINFATASQSAAIGTAAGVNADQLTRLGGVAKDVSAILGRDVGDSFNRLIRGVTKAEPELLDELGIVLRLKDAQVAYKDSLDIVGRELTSYERSQAVANFVLDQAESKYGALAEGLDNGVNGYAKLGKAVSDITDDFKRFLSIIEPVVGFLAENPWGTLLLATPLVSSALSDITAKVSDYGKALDASINTKKDNISSTISVLEKQKAAFLEATPVARIAAARKEIKGMAGEIDFSRGNLKKLAQGANLTIAQLESLKEQAAGVGTNIGFIKASDAQRDRFIGNVDQMIRASKAQGATLAQQSKLWTRASITSMKIMAAEARLAATSIKASFIGAFTSIASAASTILPIIGLGLLAISLIPEDIRKEIGIALGLLDNFSKDLEERISRAKERQEEFSKLGANLISQQGTVQSLKTLGNTIKNIPFEELKSNLSDVESVLGTEAYKKATQEVNKLQEAYDNYINTPGALKTLKDAQQFARTRDRLEELKGSLYSLRKEAGVVSLIKDLELLSTSAEKAGLSGTESFGALKQVIDSVLSGGSFDPGELEALIKTLDKLTNSANSLPELLKRTEDSYRDLSDSLILKTEFSDPIANAKAEIAELIPVINELSKSSAIGPLGLEQTDDFKRYVELLEITKELEALKSASIGVSTRQSALDVKRAGTLNTTNKLSVEESRRAKNALDIEQERNRIIDSNVALQKLDASIVKEKSATDKEALEASRSRLAADIALSGLKISELELTQQIADVTEQSAARSQKSTVATNMLQISRLKTLGNFSAETNKIANIEQDILASADKQSSLKSQIVSKQAEIATQDSAQKRRDLELLRIAEEQAATEQELLEEKLLLEKELASQQFKNARALSEIEIDSLKRSRFATKLQKDTLSIRQDIYKSVQAEKEIKQDIQRVEADLLIAKTRDPYSEQTKSLMNQVELLKLSLARQREITKERQDQLDFGKQINENLRNSLESGLQGTFASIIKNEESSIGEAILNLGKGILESLGDLLAKKLAESVSNIFFEPEADVSLVKGGEQAKSSIIEASEVLIDNATKAGQALKNSISEVEFTTKGEGAEEGQKLASTIPSEDLKVPNSSSDLSSRISLALDEGGILLSQRIRSALTGTTEASTIPEGKETSVLEKIGGESVESKPSSDTIEETPNKLGQVFGDFGNRMLKIFSKENPLIASLGDIFGGLLGSLKDVFSNIFKGLGSGGGATAAGGTGGGLGGVFGTIISALFASGGIATGGFRAFADGGTVNRPTLGMVGEGKYNEAIVPLPSGKAIPVEMIKNSSSQNNSVSVNIDMASGETKTNASEENLARFGNAISEIVQRELVDQSRPGGLLAR